MRRWGSEPSPSAAQRGPGLPAAFGCQLPSASSPWAPGCPHTSSPPYLCSSQVTSEPLPFLPCSWNGPVHSEFSASLRGHLKVCVPWGPSSLSPSVAHAPATGLWNLLEILFSDTPHEWTHFFTLSFPHILAQINGAAGLHCVVSCPLPDCSPARMPGPYFPACIDHNCTGLPSVCPWVVAIPQDPGTVAISCASAMPSTGAQRVSTQ